jgi:hypothetical protein
MAETTKVTAKIEEYTLGSGDLFIMEYTSGTAVTADDVITNGERLGEVKGGASLEYTTETKEESSDLGRTKIVIISKEDVTLKSGVMTWNGNTLEKLCQTARVTTNETKRTIKIGGLAHASNKSYALAFQYKGDGKEGLTVLIVGKNTAGFTLSFDPDNPTVIDAEFKAQALDDEGTLLVIEETIVA